MANVNRWISGRYNRKHIVPARTLSGTTVEMGDLIFIDDTDGLREAGGSTADYTAYPLSWVRPSGTTLGSKKARVQQRFLGVAMSDKDGDSISREENIPVCVNGIFDFDLKPARTVYAGDMVGPAGTTSSSNLYDQKVMKTSTVTEAIGYVVRYKTHALSCEVMIRPAMGLSNKIS